MDKNVTIIGGIAAVIIIGGLVFYNVSNTNSENGVGTGQTTQTTTPGQGQTQTSGAPVVVTSATAFPSDTTVVISGQVTPNGAFTNYWYEFGTTKSLGNKTLNQMVGSGYISIGAPAYITGLSKDTTYFFQLMAQNQFGTVAGGQYNFKTIQGIQAPIGSVPSVKTLAASGISRNESNLNGEVIANKAGTVHWFEYGKTANLGNTTALVSIGDGSVKVPASISLSDLSSATTYYFRLNAQNKFGTVNGAILNFKTTGPLSATAPSVTTKSATDLSASTATLRGTINPGGAETTYWFEYSTDSLLGSVLLRSTGKKLTGATSNTMPIELGVSDLSPKTNYYFRLVAENSQGLVRGERQTFKTK